MKFTASLILIFLGCFTGTALAADISSDPAASQIVREILDAVVHGQWWPALCAAVVLLCALERKYAPESWKTGIKGEIIGVATAFVMAFATSFGASVAAPGTTVTLAVALMALKVGAGAVGGYTILSRLLNWLAAWDKLPAWAKSVLEMIASVIGAPSPVKVAEAAGEAAVVAKPAPGMNVGKMREID